MKKRTLFTILGFLTFILSAQNKYETYSTDKFSIEYPLNWELSTVTGTQALFTISSPLESENDSFAENINLITQNLKGFEMTLDKYVKLNKEELSTIPDGEMFSSKRLKKGTQEYHLIVFKGRMSNLNLKVQQLYAIKEETAYILTFTATYETYEQYHKIGEDILNSFTLKQ